MLSQVLYFLAAFSFYVLLSKERTQESSAKHFFNLQSAVIVFKKMLVYSSVKCIKYYCFNGPGCVKLLFLALQYKHEVKKNTEHQINFSAGIPASLLLYIHTSDFQEKEEIL